MSHQRNSDGAVTRAAEALLEAVGRGLGGLVLIMTLAMTLVVGLRYLFDTGSIALQEVAAYIHGALITLGAGYTLLHDDHVRVDIFYRGWSPRRRAVVDVIGTLALLIPFSVFVVSSSLGYVAASWRQLEGSAEAGGLPGVFVLKTLIPAMGVLLIVAGVVRAVRSVAMLRGPS